MPHTMALNPEYVKFIDRWVYTPYTLNTEEVR
jgi:hypothetical protein